LGMTKGTPAKFVRRYANLGPEITDALAHFARDVRNGEFPGPNEVYANPDDLLN